MVIIESLLAQINLLTLVGTMLTLLIVPLILDGIKRSWDYSTTISKAKFDILADLSILFWDYHGAAQLLMQMTKPHFISPHRTQDIEEWRREFIRTSGLFYSRIFSYESKIEQYYDNHKAINKALAQFIDYFFHVYSPNEIAPDGRIIQLAEDAHTEDQELRDILTAETIIFRNATKIILQLLAKELQDSRSYWYPITRHISRNSDADLQLPIRR